jgi:hypothetical protein
VRGTICSATPLCLLLVLATTAPAATLRGTIVDAASGQALPARVHLRSADGKWFFPKSAAAEGSAVEYKVERGPKSVEMHTTLSAHPWTVDLPPGRYTLSVERGKEYLPVEREVEVGQSAAEVKVKLRRWIDMAQRGWYSGDTHVHRTLADLPNLVLAEDLNVALPLTAWVTHSDLPPSRANRAASSPLRPAPIAVDQAHLVYPLNTEYEIFTTSGKQHTLGAVFVLGHQRPLELGVPPVGPVAAEARRQGALLELDKHCWPWSLMLVSQMDVDLFELANNHCWRTEFGFPQWGLEFAPKFMQLETDAAGFTERGWLDFGFKTYYLLLNCGFRLRPTAGTASGVHPVPLGFGRVYVHQPDGFDYAKWMQALNAGRSFVTTGPMLHVEIEGQGPGGARAVASSPHKHRITGAAESALPLERIEVIANGELVQTLEPANRPTATGGYLSPIDVEVSLDGSAWLAVRCFERRADKRLRFAHSSPVFFDVPGAPLRPRREEVEYLVGRMEEELARNAPLLSAEALDEYRQARARFAALRAAAR